MTKYILEVIFLFLKNKSWTLGDVNLNPPKGEGVQVPPIWEELETLRFQVPFPKTSNQTYEKGTWNLKVSNSIPFLHTKHSPSNLCQKAKKGRAFIKKMIKKKGCHGWDIVTVRLRKWTTQTPDVE